MSSDGRDLSSAPTTPTEGRHRQADSTVPVSRAGRSATTEPRSLTRPLSSSVLQERMGTSGYASAETSRSETSSSTRRRASASVTQAYTWAEGSSSRRLPRGEFDDGRSGIRTTGVLAGWERPGCASPERACLVRPVAEARHASLRNGGRSSRAVVSTSRPRRARRKSCSGPTRLACCGADIRRRPLPAPRPPDRMTPSP
jgi:hypothetical protein